MNIPPIEWHAGKAAANSRTHGVSFEEASTVFLDSNLRREFDTDHSDDEDRWLVLGLSSRLGFSRSFTPDVMKRSVSSVLAERRKQRKAVTPRSIVVRHVKFSPAEMAYEPPDDTSRFTYVGRGPDNLFEKPPKHEKRLKAESSKPLVALDADIAKVFKTAESVNKALRKLIEAMPSGRKVKSKGPKRVA